MPIFNRVLLLLLLFPLYINAQVITTIAGTGAFAYSGDGGQATAACLNHPYDIAFDSKGNIYFSEQNNNVVRKIDHAGIISTVAGNGTSGYSGDGGPAVTAQLSFPLGIAIDRADNLLITEWGNHCIRMVDTFGNITTIAGTGTSGYNGDGIAATGALLSSPYDVVVDSAGNIYISDWNNFRIRKIDLSGMISTIAGTGSIGYSADGTAATSAFIQPHAIALDLNQNICFSDSDAIIRRVSSTGLINTIVGTRMMGVSGDGVPATTAKLTLENGSFEFKPDGEILIADGGNARIRKVDNSGIISTIAGTNLGGYGGDGGDPLLAKFNFPSCSVTDRFGHIYIADLINGRVRCIGCDSTLSVADMDKPHPHKLSVQPNPVTTGKVTLFLASPETKAINLTIKDMVGRTVLEVPITTNAPKEVELKLPKGMYFVTGRVCNTVLTEKIVIQ